MCLLTDIDTALCTFPSQIVKEYERAIIFRLGRILRGGAKGPGGSSVYLGQFLPCQVTQGGTPHCLIHRQHKPPTEGCIQVAYERGHQDPNDRLIII